MGKDVLFATEVFWIAAKVFQGVGGRGDQEGVQPRWVLPSQGPQFTGLGIARGGGGTGMAEQALEMTQTEALFEQVRRKAVAQRMEGDFFLIPHSRQNRLPVARW